MKRVGKLAIMAGAGASLLGAGPAALAAATPKGGKVQVFVTGTSATKSKITVTGAIGDYGTTISQDKNGNPDPNGDFQKVTLKHGGFLVDATALDQRLNKLRPTINPTNCSVFGSASGPTKVLNGTGAYTGVSGTVRITVTFAGIGPKKADGSCNLSNNAPTHGAVTVITGTGRVSFH